MGVPKFFRWAAERYPTVITPFKDSPPPIDHLYLDMNGIIHNCTHPNDIDASRKAPTEQEMVSAIYAYLEKLFNAIQPRKTFLMAVDGVAPRAKMNQQRQRRYRAGYDMMVAREEALKRGEEIPEEGDVFDSNCITPGTDFMVRMNEHFKYFVTMKQQTDAAWQNCEVILSGHDHPGEGEHKIIEYVRRRKMQPGYLPNETHCMYGLDADLVMLALATHEPHFVLLREVVSFNQGTKKERERKEEDAAKGIAEDKTYAKADEFVLLHINIFREYLELDILHGLEEKPATYNFERVVDDFVFMCFFIGNDFLPSIPTVAINDGGMNTMMEIYREYILSRGSFLVRDGKPNWNAIEIFLNKIGELELETLKARQQEEEEYAKRAARRDPDHEVKHSSMPITSIVEYKQRFYGEKHGFADGWQPRGEDLMDLRQHFIEGLMWVMEYYYQGPPSWKWYYPHHYAPLASDMIGLSGLASRVRFDKGQPFLPHQQLLAVLPPMSHRLLPPAYGPLLRSSSSPLVKFFPKHLEIDREGARAPWEGIVLIPFIDEKTLLLAYESVQSRLTPEEKNQNKLGPPVLYRFNPEVAPYTVPAAMFPALKDVRVERTPFEFPPYKTFVADLCPEVRMGTRTLEGFSSLASRLPRMTVKKEQGAVNIFGMTSRRESCLLIHDEAQEPLTVDSLIHLVGAEVYVGWPHLKRAKVAGITDRRRTIISKYNQDGYFNGVESKDLTAEQIFAFKKEAETHENFLKTKCGLVLNGVDVLVYAHRLVGMRITRKGRVIPQYSKKETCYPIQLVCRKDEIDLLPDSRYEERDRDASDFQMGSQLIYIGNELKGLKQGSAIGAKGFVMESPETDGDGMFKVALRVFLENQKIPRSLVDYASSHTWKAIAEVSEMVGVSSMVVSQICSSVMTSAMYGSVELGLCLKFTGKNLARVGYAKLVQTAYNPWYVGAPDIFERMINDDNATGHHLDGVKGEYLGRSSVNQSGRGTWYFSPAAIQLIDDYVKRFRPLIRRLSAGGSNSSSLEPQEFLIEEWADRAPEDVVAEIEKFIEESGIQQVSMLPATEDSFTKGHLKELEEMLEECGPRPTKEITAKQVLRRNLHFPTMRSPEGYVMPVPLPKDQKYQIGSRVVYCRSAGNVPFGATGTITRMLAAGQNCEVVFDSPFTGGSLLGGRLRTNRGAICKLGALFVTDQIAEGETLASKEEGRANSWVPIAIDASPGGGVNLAAALSAKLGAGGGALNDGAIRAAGTSPPPEGQLPPSPPSIEAGNGLPKPRSKQANPIGQSPPPRQPTAPVPAEYMDVISDAPALPGATPVQSAFLSLVRQKLERKLNQRR